MSFRKCRHCGRAMAFVILLLLPTLFGACFWTMSSVKLQEAFSKGGRSIIWQWPTSPLGQTFRTDLSVKTASWLDGPPTVARPPSDSTAWERRRRWNNIFLVFSRRGSDGLYDWLPTPCSLPLPAPTQRRQSLLAARVTLRFCGRLISWRGRPPPLQLCDRGLALDDGDICPIIPEGGTPAAHFQFISMSLPATANWIKPPRSWEAVWSRSFYCRPKRPKEQKKKQTKKKKLKGFYCWFVYFHIKWVAHKMILYILRDFLPIREDKKIK